MGSPFFMFGSPKAAQEAPMSRILGIDYGGKRTGLAVTDPLQVSVNALTTVHSASLLEYLDTYLDQHEVETIVVGYPLNSEGDETDATPLVKGFVRKARKRYPAYNIVTWDERYSSQEARQAMMAQGIPKKQRQQKAAIDKASAAVILQSYLGVL
jgi:putative Holliday junction resolvase